MDDMTKAGIEATISHFEDDYGVELRQESRDKIVNYLNIIRNE